jgi:phage terminase small subunit
MSEKLTQFQELFCREYIKTGNASAAYRAVSPNAKNWKDETVWRAAKRMMDVSKVGTRIAELQAQAARSSVVTVDSLNLKLENIIVDAHEDKQFAVCVAAVMGQAKLFGFLVDKKEIRTGGLDDLDVDQLKHIKNVLRSVNQTVSVGPEPDRPGETAH